MKGKAGLLAAVVVASATGFWWWTTTPTYALTQIRSAVRTHDLTKFEKYVDAESMSSRLVDDLMAEMVDASSSADGAEALGATLGAGIAQLMKPRLVEIVTEQIARAVEEGDWGADSDSSDAMLDELQSVFGQEEAAFGGVKAIKKDGKVAVVELEFSDSESEDDLLLRFKMRDVGSHWRLVELENLRGILASYREQREQELARANAPIREVLESSVGLANARTERREDQWGISKSVVLHLKFRNKSDREIESFNALIEIMGRSGATIKKVPIAHDDPLARSKLSTGAWSIDVGMFDDAAQTLYGMDPGTAAFTAEITEIAFASGEKVRLFSSLDEVPQ